MTFNRTLSITVYHTTILCRYRPLKNTLFVLQSPCPTFLVVRELAVTVDIVSACHVVSDVCALVNWFEMSCTVDHGSGHFLSNGQLTSFLFHGSVK